MAARQLRPCAPHIRVARRCHPAATGTRPESATRRAAARAPSAYYCSCLQRFVCSQAFSKALFLPRAPRTQREHGHGERRRARRAPNVDVGVPSWLPAHASQSLFAQAASGCASGSDAIAAVAADARPWTRTCAVLSYACTSCSAHPAGRTGLRCVRKSWGPGFLKIVKGSLHPAPSAAPLSTAKSPRTRNPALARLEARAGATVGASWPQATFVLVLAS